jgi:hypothetical protein
MMNDQIMKVFRGLSIIAIAFVLLSCNRVPEKNMAITQDLLSYLPEGKFDVQVFGEVSYGDPMLVTLQKKMTEAIQKNAEWFAEYRKNNSLPLPYHKNLGLTPAEYNEFLRLSSANKPILKRTSVLSLDIMHKKTEIQFRGVGQLQFFDDVIIHFKDRSITLDEKKLKYLTEESAPDTNNIFRSPWKGYTWQYLSPDNALQIPKDEYQKKNVTIYKVTIGKLEKGNRTFIITKGIEYDKGEKVFDFEAPIIF